MTAHAVHAPMRTFAALSVTLALALGLTTSALAQAYPSRPVRIVIPFPPGGGIDVLVRAVAERLAARWGQAVIVDNRSGAGSLIGAEAVAHAAADGYTLMATVNQTFTANRFLYKSLPYDPDRSFTPITLMVQSDHFLLAHPALPAEDLRELVALARKPQAALNSAVLPTLRPRHEQSAARPAVNRRAVLRRRLLETA